jgi:hypothetical protein
MHVTELVGQKITNTWKAITELVGLRTKQNQWTASML